MYWRLFHKTQILWFFLLKILSSFPPHFGINTKPISFSQGNPSLWFSPRSCSRTGFWSTIPQILCYSHTEILTLTQIWQAHSYCKHGMLGSFSLVYLWKSEYVSYLILRHSLELLPHEMISLLFLALILVIIHYTARSYLTLQDALSLYIVESDIGLATSSCMDPSLNSPQGSLQNVCCR